MTGDVVNALSQLDPPRRLWQLVVTGQGDAMSCGDTCRAIERTLELFAYVGVFGPPHRGRKCQRDAGFSQRLHGASRLDTGPHISERSERDRHCLSGDRQQTRPHRDTG